VGLQTLGEARRLDLPAQCLSVDVRLLRAEASLRDLDAGLASPVGTKLLRPQVVLAGRFMGLHAHLDAADSIFQLTRPAVQGLRQGGEELTQRLFGVE
jgi:hypothetical protein